MLNLPTELFHSKSSTKRALIQRREELNQALAMLKSNDPIAKDIIRQIKDIDEKLKTL